MLWIFKENFVWIFHLVCIYDFRSLAKNFFFPFKTKERPKEKTNAFNKYKQRHTHRHTHIYRSTTLNMHRQISYHQQNLECVDERSGREVSAVSRNAETYLIHSAWVKHKPDGLSFLCMRECNEAKNLLKIYAINLQQFFVVGIVYVKQCFMALYFSAFCFFFWCLFIDVIVGSSWYARSSSSHFHVFLSTNTAAKWKKERIRVFQIFFLLLCMTLYLSLLCDVHVCCVCVCVCCYICRVSLNFCH